MDTHQDDSYIRSYIDVFLFSYDFAMQPITFVKNAIQNKKEARHTRLHSQ
jgi:hypothetical protein